jgi:hypothetical protein
MSIQKMARFQSSPAYSIRSNLVFGLKLCASARTKNRIGSAVRAQQHLVKAKRVVENTSRHLNQKAELSVPDRCQLGKLVDHLKTSIGGLDPLWVPTDDGTDAAA